MFQLKWIWHNLKGRRLLYVTGILLSVLSSAMYIINPKLSQVLVDNVITGVKNANGQIIHHTEMLLPLLIFMALNQLAITSFRYLMIMALEHSSQYMLIKIRDRLYDNLQQQEMTFYDKFRTGDLMTRLTGDLDMVRYVVAWVTYNIIDSVVLFLSTIIFFFTISWKMTLALAAVTPFIFAATYIFSKKIRPVYVSLREKLSNLNTAAQENISGNRVVKAFNREEYEIEKFKEKNNEFRSQNLKASYTWLKFFPLFETLAQSLTIITVLVGGIFIINGELTYGQLMAFSTLTWAVSNPMRMLGSLLNDIQRFFASANKVIELYYARPLILNRHDAVKLEKRLSGEVRFEDVSFGYDGRQVLKNINLEIKPGETIGIMGPTGSGKTTLVNLLLRFYDVTSGRITLDGINIRDLSLESLRSNIGMATQDVFLFSDTIDGNIAYGDPDMPEDDAKRYAVSADADEFITKMPDSYDTIIGERGVGLSGGQKQRIALARALAVRPSILILDDTTSAVDLETEKYIQQSLSSLDFECTKIIIAQRISSVKDADKIIVVKDHGISEAGTHKQLIQNRGYYYEIFKLQQEGVAAGAGELTHA